MIRQPQEQGVHAMNRPLPPHRRARRRGRATAMAAAAVALALGLFGMAGGGCTRNGGPDEDAPGRRPGGDVVEVPSANFAAVWRAQVPLRNAEVRSVSVNDAGVFVYNSNNDCVWLDRAAGTIRVQTNVAPRQDTLYPPVALGDRVVFVSTGQITVLSKETGRLMYRMPLRFSASSGAAGEGAAIFFGQNHPNGGRLVALDTRPTSEVGADKTLPHDITPAWELMPRGLVSAAPAVFQGSVYMGSRDGGVYAVRAEDREVIWPGLEGGSFRTGGEIHADLAADKDGVYVSSMDTKLYCLNLNTGRVKWRFHSGAGLREEATPVPTATHVYLYVRGRGLIAIDKSGQLEVRNAKWVLPEGRQLVASDDRFAYVASADRKILAVDKQTGQVRFTSRRNDFVAFATNTSDKDPHIYAITANGLLYKIRPVLRPGTVGEWVMDFEEAETRAVALAR